MTHDGCICDTQRLEEAVRIQSELIESKLIGGRLRRFAESDLVWHNYTVASSKEDIDGGVPGAGAEVLPMEEDDIAHGFTLR